MSFLIEIIYRKQILIIKTCLKRNKVNLLILSVQKEEKLKIIDLMVILNIILIT